MDTVDKMSAAELSSKLAEYGYPIIPITGSTRSVMTKKLRLLMSKRPPLARYSSGEESEDERQLPPARQSPTLQMPTLQMPTFKFPTPPPVTRHRDSETELNAIRARLGLSDAPYLSDFARNLASSSNGYKSHAATSTRNTNRISLTIAGAGVAFFAALAFAYLTMLQPRTPFDPSGSDSLLPICSPNGPDHRPTINCIRRAELAPALDLLKALRPELLRRASAVDCDSIGVMNQHDVMEFVKTSFGERNADDLLNDFHNVQALISVNPNWKISLVKLDSTLSALSSMEYAAPLRAKNLIGLACLDRPTSFKCIAFNKIYSLLNIVFLVLTSLAVAYALYRAIVAYRSRRSRRRDEIYATVERIIDYISHEDRCGGFTPVEHVRDALVPPQERERAALTWSAAVDHLRDNESRALFQTETVDGEEYATVRWISPPVGGAVRRSRAGGARAWQGQAFETQTGSVNNLGFSPTPCLKIRHMMEKSDKNPDLNATIKDAILEKCGPDCRILHMDVDRASCCVFVKCASPADAGVVYQSLHGWWYQSRLITVKYLRLERYMEHFPSSPSSGPYLKPSNDWKSSDQ